MNLREIPHTDTHTDTPEPAYTDINMSQIRVGGGVIGFLFAAGTAYIFLVGVPAVRWFFVGAAALGGLISVALRIFHNHKPARTVNPIPF